MATVERTMVCQHDNLGIHITKLGVFQHPCRKIHDVASTSMSAFNSTYIHDGKPTAESLRLSTYSYAASPTLAQGLHLHYPGPQTQPWHIPSCTTSRHCSLCHCESFEIRPVHVHRQLAVWSLHANHCKIVWEEASLHFHAGSHGKRHLTGKLVYCFTIINTAM